MPIQYAGGTNVNVTFTGNVRSDIQVNISSNLVTAGWTKIALLAGQGVGNSGTVTITIASPGVVTFTGHGFLGGEKIILQTTGALPTGLSVNTVYFVKFIDANTFNLATTLGGANINTSGSQSGVHTLNTQDWWLRSSASHPQGIQLDVDLKDNLGSCIQFSIRGTVGTIPTGGSSTTAGGSLLPSAGRTFRIIANRYQFVCMFTGVFNLSREFVIVSCPYIPSPLSVPSPANAGLMMSDSIGDASASQTASFRTTLLTCNQNSCGNMQSINGNNILENANNVQNSASCGNLPNLLLNINGGNAGGSVGGGGGTFRWASGNIMASDALITCGLAVVGTDESQVRFQLWDAIVINNSYPGDTTTSFDAHNWIAITNSFAGIVGVGALGQCAPKGCLFLVTP